MIIYADVLVILNVFVTYFLLLCTKLLLRKTTTCKRKNILFASILGGFYSLILLFPSIPMLLLILVNFLFSLLLVFLAFFPKSFKSFLKVYMSFLIIHFLYIGLIFIFLYYIQPDKLIFKNGFLYFDIQFTTLLITTSLCYILLEIFEKLFQKKAPDTCYYTIEIIHHEKEYRAIGFLDTGHSLSDGFSNIPVLVAEPKFYKKICTENLINMDRDSIIQKEKIRMIPYKDLSSNGILQAILIDKVIIPEKKLQIQPALLAKSKEDFQSNDFQILFGNDLIEGGILYDQK